MKVPIVMPQVNSTRRQHYVPQAYLSRWCDTGGMIAVSVDGRILRTRGTKNFAVEIDLYSFIDLSADELDYLHKTIKQIVTEDNPLLTLIVVPIFLNVLYFRCEKRDWSEKYKEVFDKFSLWMRDSKHIELYGFLRRVAEGDGQLNQQQIGTQKQVTASGFEALMTGIENAAWPVIEKLLLEGAGCLKDICSMKSLLLYLVTQNFRGPDYITAIKRAWPEKPHELGETPNLACYLRYIIPFHILNNLLNTKNQRKFFVIDNRTDLEFVTGDVPCVTYGEKSNPKTPLIMYFPMSPKRAMLFGYKDAVNKYIKKYGWKLKDRELVNWFNQEVAANSCRFVFASKISVLKENAYSVGNNRAPSYAK